MKLITRVSLASWYFALLVFHVVRNARRLQVSKQTIPGRQVCRSHKSDILHLPIFRPNQFTSDGHFSVYLSIHPSFPSCCVVCFCFLPYFISTTHSFTCLLSLNRLAMRTQNYHSVSVYKRCQHIPITINDKVIPHSNTETYFNSSTNEYTYNFT